jgi:hypothetical protein
VQGIAVMNELRGLARDIVNDFVKEQGGLGILELTHASSGWANPNSQALNPQDPLTYNLPNMNGVEIIVQLLHRTWGPDEQQLNLDYMTDFFSLRTMPVEPIDNYMHRAELVYRRCHSNCGFELSSSGLAYLLIQQLRISNSELLPLLIGFQGYYSVILGNSCIRNKKLRHISRYCIRHNLSEHIICLSNTQRHPL